jgi:hypothetical protein
MHLDHAHLFDELRVTSFAGRAGRVTADRGQLFCERRVNCEISGCESGIADLAAVTLVTWR